MKPCKNEKLYFLRRRNSIDFKRFTRINEFIALREWMYASKDLISKKKKEVDATIREKFLSLSTIDNMTSSCSHLIHFAKFLKNEIMVMKLKLWTFRPKWCAALNITSYQFQASFLWHVEKTTFFIKFFEDSCCKWEGKMFFKLVFLASFWCLRRYWAIPNLHILLHNRKITVWIRLTKFYNKKTTAKSCEKKLWHFNSSSIVLIDLKKLFCTRVHLV